MSVRIGFSGFVLQGGKSGIATYCQQLTKALQSIDQENEYQVFTTRNDATLLSAKGPNFEIDRSLNFVGRPIPNILWHHMVLPWKVHHDELDLVHVPSIRRIPLVKAGPLVATVHDLAPLVVSDKYDSYRQFYHKHVLQRAIHKVDRIISVSGHTKNDLVTLLGVPQEKVTVIYPGIDHILTHELDRASALIHLQQRFQLDKTFIVYVSRLEHPGKNHQRLLKAFELFKKRHGGNIQLVLAGADWSGAKFIRECAEENSYRRDIHFLGYVSNDDVQALYAACELMIYPSLYEGFGLPILEALACGVRVSCSNTSSMAELGKGRIPLFDPLSVTSICQGIEQGLQQELNPKFKSYARAFTWERAARETLNVYREVVRKNGV